MEITVVLPIYNVEKYIKKCINSLMEQTFDDFEILAIIDGSPDNSLEILKKMNNSRIKIIEKENGGYGSVLELAIKTIKSPYFLICDPDDWLEPKALEKLYNSIKTSESDLAISNYFLRFADNTLKEINVFPNQYVVKPNTRIVTKDCFAFAAWSPHGKLYKTQLALGIKFPHKVNFTDEILYLVYLSRARSFVYVDEYLANYYFERPGNSCSELNNYDFKTFKQQITVYDFLITQISTKEDQNLPIFARLFVSLVNLQKKCSLLNEQKIVCMEEIKRRIFFFKTINILKFIKGTSFVKTIIKRIKYGYIRSKR